MATTTTVPIHAGEEPVFFRLFAAVRSEELGMQAWDATLRDQMLRLQFSAQRRGYRDQYPALVERFILRDGLPVGWIVTDRSGAAVRCVDIAIVSDERRKGVASSVLRELQEEAAATGRPVAMSAVRTNAPALALYDRLGFQPVGETDVHIFLEWRGDQARTET